MKIRIHDLLPLLRPTRRPRPLSDACTYSATIDLTVELVDKQRMYGLESRAVCAMASGVSPHHGQ